jgi:hypothetical protein
MEIPCIHVPESVERANEVRPYYLPRDLKEKRAMKPSGPGAVFDGSDLIMFHTSFFVNRFPR